MKNSLSIHNHLINVRNLKYSYIHYKILFKCIQNYLYNKDIFFTKKIEVKEILKSNNYSEIKNSIVGLYKPIIIENIEKKELETIGIFSSIKYKKGYIDFNFTNEILPFIKNLKNNFTQIDIDNIIKLKLSYSIKLYLFLKKESFKDKIIIDINELYDILEVPKSYRVYREFKRNVLNKVYKDFLNSNFLIKSIEEIKKSRRVIKIIFNIKNKNILLNEYIKEVRKTPNKILGVHKETDANIYINKNGLLTISGSILNKEESHKIYEIFYNLNN